MGGHFSGASKEQHCAGADKPGANSAATGWPVFTQPTDGVLLPSTAEANGGEHTGKGAVAIGARKRSFTPTLGSL